ncbi:hypothetical protein SS209_00587 [Salmonella enterica subsp. enterica serovar Senftenberg str. SS209]|nr:hypothetical protein SS209_00587 [Salmonella enterica subsp. enterica serovar Senftenberg str. SS209]
MDFVDDEQYCVA